MKLDPIRENADGSADFTFTFDTEEERLSIMRLGIIKALEMAIEEAKKYDPGPLDNDTFVDEAEQMGKYGGSD